jgi:alkyl sulfatase BDS1-like metallo-beta-lactamase superfamily hydrolase
MKQYLVATIISLLTSNAFSEVVTAPTDQRVNPKVLAHQATLVPGLKKLGSRVFGAEFMGYSNFGFIETDNGVIVVDAGWFPTPTANAYALLREQTDKPVIAVIYTHLHMDHYGGIQAILPGNNPGAIPIYGPADWEDTVAMGQSVTHKATLRPRLYANGHSHSRRSRRYRRQWYWP